jgi:hypothetical protein
MPAEPWAFTRAGSLIDQVCRIIASERDGPMGGSNAPLFTLRQQNNPKIALFRTNLYCLRSLQQHAVQ